MPRSQNYEAGLWWENDFLPENYIPEISTSHTPTEKPDLGGFYNFPVAKQEGPVNSS